MSTSPFSPRVTSPPNSLLVNTAVVESYAAGKSSGFNRWQNPQTIWGNLDEARRARIKVSLGHHHSYPHRQSLTTKYKVSKIPTRSSGGSTFPLAFFHHLAFPRVFNILHHQMLGPSKHRHVNDILTRYLPRRDFSVSRVQ